MRDVDVGVRIAEDGMAWGSDFGASVVVRSVYSVGRALATKYGEPCGVPYGRMRHCAALH